MIRPESHLAIREDRARARGCAPRTGGLSRSVAAHACGLLLSAALAAGPSLAGPDGIGFPGAAGYAQSALEQRFAVGIDGTNLRTWLRRLSARPHHTGSPGGREVAETLVEQFRAWGFNAQIETFYALVPAPRVRTLQMLSPMRFSAQLAEPRVATEPAEWDTESLPPYNVYSRDGDVSGEAVYVNYGMPEDYDVLARYGIGVRGRIVIARYGKGWRGVKPRLAAEHGAIGAVLYSDPADYGYAQGATYPEGPFLPDSGYQRGSVLNLPLRAGDPLSPGRGALEPPDDYRLDDAAEVISPIPVLPASAGDIRPFLEAMTGTAVPVAWRGALPLTYRFDGGVTLRLAVEQDWDIVPLHNVVARIEGSEWPDEWILRGNNHDAWNHGALVALSGLVALMEEARGIGQLAKNGWKPRRTLVYLAWDGEEQGLLGSTEWAEAHADELQRKAVAYINSGVNTRGFFSVGGSHSLEALVDDVAHAVTDPRLGVSVYERVAARTFVYGDPDERRDLAEYGRYRLTPLGMGSDWTPFLQHLGIPSLDIGFDGEAPSGIYHSLYDNFDSYDRFGDPGYEYGKALAEAGGRLTLRLANARILPFEYTGMAFAVDGYLRELAGLVGQARAEAERVNTALDMDLYRLADDPAGRLSPPRRTGEVPDLEFAPLAAAVERLTGSAKRFALARLLFEQQGGTLGEDDTRRLNATLAHAEQALAPQHGLPGRPWYRHQVYAPGYDTGYAVKTLPAVREAIEAGRWQLASTEIRRLAQAVDAYSAQIDSATRILETATRQVSSHGLH